jgi:hypothetical protein
MRLNQPTPESLTTVTNFSLVGQLWQLRQRGQQLRLWWVQQQPGSSFGFGGFSSSRFSSAAAGAELHAERKLQALQRVPSQKPL